MQAASLTYFDKDVWEITLPQAALLAGLPQAPTAYNPFENPDEARARRNVVLDEMADQGFITQERADQAKLAGLALKRGQAYKRKREEYFFEYVRQVLIDRYGEKQVQNGGFKVYTTIDPALQSAAAPRHPGEPLLRRRPRRRGGHGRLPEGVHPGDGLEPALLARRTSSTSPPRRSASRARPSRPSC